MTWIQPKLFGGIVHRFFTVVLATGLVLGAVAMPSSAVPISDGVLEIELPIGDGPSTAPVEVGEAGNLRLQAEASSAAVSTRDSTGEGVGVDEDRTHPVEQSTPVSFDASLQWAEDVRSEREEIFNELAAQAVVTHEFTPTAAGELAIDLGWSATNIIGSVTRTASSPVSGTSSAQSTSLTAPDLFEVNAPGTVTGILSWPESTVPPRNLDLTLTAFNSGTSESADSLVDNPERIDSQVPSSV